MSIIARFTVIAGIWILFSEMPHPQWIPAESMVNTATPYVSGAADRERRAAWRREHPEAFFYEH
jgi:hypothetical protein